VHNSPRAFPNKLLGLMAVILLMLLLFMTWLEFPVAFL
jgi:hypothetical protein